MYFHVFAEVCFADKFRAVRTGNLLDTVKADVTLETLWLDKLFMTPTAFEVLICNN